MQHMGCRLRKSRRVNKTASQYGVRTTTIYTDPDARSQHALSSPNAVNLGHSSAYLDGDKIIEAAKEHGCMSIHPGYGFVRSRMESLCMIDAELFAAE